MSVKLQNRYLSKIFLMIICIVCVASGLVACGCEKAPNTQVVTPEVITNDSPITTVNSRDTTYPANSPLPLKYQWFELKDEDIKGYPAHPRYAFEYPDRFEYVGKLWVWRDITGISWDFTRADFNYSNSPLPESYISIEAQKPGYKNISDAHDLVNLWLVVAAASAGEKVKRETVTISGSQAEVIEFEYYSDKVQLYYATKRMAIFEHGGIIWRIELNWNSLNSESPEVSQYFQYITETFKFLENPE